MWLRMERSFYLVLRMSQKAWGSLRSRATGSFVSFTLDGGGLLLKKVDVISFFSELYADCCGINSCEAGIFSPILLSKPAKRRGLTSYRVLNSVSV